MGIKNSKAYRDFIILKTWESGIELKGSEVKSIREGNANLNDSFARVENNQVLLYNMHISPYAQASYLNEDPIRIRRLLLHKEQIRKIADSVLQRGFVLIPLRLYFNARGFVKIELALGKGKRFFDKRRDIKRRQEERDLRRVIRRKRG